MVKCRFSLCVVLIGVSLAARRSASKAEMIPSRCISGLQMKYGTSPAFKIACTSLADCVFEPSQPMNASAVALIDVMAKTVIECWQKEGLTTAVPIPSPPSLNLSVQSYRTSGGRVSEVCNIAQLRPFGQDRLTTSFRAACHPSEQK